MTENETITEQEEITATEGKTYDPMVLEFYGKPEEKPEIEQSNEETEVKPDEVVIEEAKPTAEEVKETVVVNKWEDSITDPHARWIADTLAKEGGEEEIYNAIKDKYTYKEYTPEQKVIAFLAAENPELDDNELLFLAAQDFGIGVETDEEAELTPEEKGILRAQGIARKKAVSQADKYFQERANAITLPTLPNPLDNDEGYKAYQASLAKQQEITAQQAEDQKNIDAVLLEMNTTAKTFEKIDIDLKLDLDGGEFAIKSDFKLDAKKQQQLADYALRYQPSENEVKAFTDTNGKFDMKGYMAGLAKQCFSDQLIKAAVKQALSQDRERFVEGELYNNKLRNNDISESTDRPLEMWEMAMGK
ncbi:MAG: hypothetical protein JWQ09_5888 [Segetibacter sp.]|nr:hypothetical protein [Segetibacter sp.]